METVKASGKDTTGLQEPAPSRRTLQSWPERCHLHVGWASLRAAQVGKSQGCPGRQGADLQSLDSSLNPNDKDKTEMQKFPECHR